MLSDNDSLLDIENTQDTITMSKAMWATFVNGASITLVRAVPTLSTFLGGVILSYTNPKTIAANTIIMSSQSVVLSISTAPLLYINTSVGELCKQNKGHDIGRIVQQGWVYSAISSGASLLILLNIDPILQLCGQNADMANIADSYFRAFIWGIPASQVTICSNQYAFGSKNSFLPVSVGLLGILIFAGSGYVLTYGKFGFPALGIMGLGYASAIRSWSNFLHMHLRLFLNKTSRKNHGLFSAYYDGKKRAFLILLKKGVPIMVNMISTYGVLFLSTILIGRLGEMQLSTEQVIAQYQALFYVPIIAISLSNNINISNSFGNNKNIRKYGSSGLILGVGLSVFYFSMLSLFTKKFANAFIRDDYSQKEDIIALTKTLFPLVGTSQFFATIGNISSGSLRGLRDTFVPMLINLGSTWLVGVPLAIALGFSMELGMVGISIGAGVGCMVAAGSLISRFFSKSSEQSIQQLVIDAQQEQTEVKIVEEEEINLLTQTKSSFFKSTEVKIVEEEEINLLTQTKSSFFKSDDSDNIDSINAVTYGSVNNSV